MPTQTEVETYPKATVTNDQMNRRRDRYLKAGASSCTLTDDGTNWILTTVWPEVAT